MLAFVPMRRRSAAVVARTRATLFTLAGKCVWKCVRHASNPTRFRYASTAIFAFLSSHPAFSASDSAPSTIATSALPHSSASSRAVFPSQSPPVARR